MSVSRGSNGAEGREPGLREKKKRKREKKTAKDSKWREEGQARKHHAFRDTWCRVRVLPRNREKGRRRGRGGRGKMHRSRIRATSRQISWKEYSRTAGIHRPRCNSRRIETRVHLIWNAEMHSTARSNSRRSSWARGRPSYFRARRTACKRINMYNITCRRPECQVSG